MGGRIDSSIVFNFWKGKCGAKRFILGEKPVYRL